MHIAHQGVLQVKGAVKRLDLSTSLMRPFWRLTMPLVWGDFGGVRRCSILSSVQSWSNSCSPDSARAREAKSRSVNSCPLSVNILTILIGPARCRSRRNLRACST